MLANESTEHIVSFALWGDSPKYVAGAISNARLVKTLYGPQWTGRFYVGDDVQTKVLDDLRAEGGEVVVFDRAEWASRSPATLRFAPASEKSVSVVVVRDCDSRINLRECAAVQEWLASGLQYSAMHEAMHDCSYGEIMGGMWGARKVSGSETPCPHITPEVLSSWRHRGEYGDDMAFLSEVLVPHLSTDTFFHHVSGVRDRPLGRLHFPRHPFPYTPYRGFVGQPIECSCDPDLFVSLGCPHISRKVPGALASLVKSEPGVLAALGSFLG